MSSQFSKSERSKLRNLAAEAHEYELAEAMSDLHDKFGSWADKQISVFDLNDELHKFHDGVSRDLYKLYVLSKPELSVAVAISRHVLTSDEVGSGIMEKLEPLVMSLGSLNEST